MFMLLHKKRLDNRKKADTDDVYLSSADSAIKQNNEHVTSSCFVTMIRRAIPNGGMNSMFEYIPSSF